MHVTAFPNAYQTYSESEHAARGRWNNAIVSLCATTRGRGVSLTVCRPDVAAGLETRAGYGVVASGRLAAVEIQARPSPYDSPIHCSVPVSPGAPYFRLTRTAS